MFRSSVCSPASSVVVCIACSGLADSIFPRNAESGRKKADSTSLCVRHSTNRWLFTTSLFCPQEHTPLPYQKLFLAVRSRKGLEGTDIYQDDFWGPERRIISLVINSLSTWNEESLGCFLPDLMSTIILNIMRLLYMLVKIINEHSILYLILSAWQKS